MVFLCSVEFCFSLFISYLFLFRVLLFCFVLLNNYLQLRSVELFSATDKKKLKRKLNRQNRNKMGEVRQRKLIANHQQFNKWIKQIIGFLTSRFFSHLFLFRVLLFCSFLFNAKIKKTTFEFICHNRAKKKHLFGHYYYFKWVSQVRDR